MNYMLNLDLTCLNCIPELSNFQEELMKSKEDFIDFSTHWYDLYAKSSLKLPKKQCVKQIIRNFIPKIRDG